MSSLTDVEAVIVAGGRATRMGGVDKPALVVGGRRLLDIALTAVGGCRRIAVVGPRRDDLDPAVIQVQEEPAGAGPVAALAAAGVHEPVVLTLAADLPFLTADTVAALVEALRGAPGSDAAFAVDDSGRIQFLLAAWRGPALAGHLAALGADPANQPMKALLPERYVTVPVAGTADCDTPQELAQARAARSGLIAADPEAARAALRKSLPRLPVRTRAPQEAEGATLAAPLVAAEALPRAAVSAMDGYAVAGDGPWLLRPEVHRAGAAEPFTLQTGQAARIATGAYLPPGATTVVRDEHVEVTDGTVTRIPGAPVRDDARRRGEDWAPGVELAAAGVALGPAVISAALSGEVTAVQVRGPVRVHVVVTGDEIRRDGPLREGQTRDSLGPVLPRFVQWCGAAVAGEAHLRDTGDGFDRLFGETTGVDAIVVAGATGGGAADQLRSALARAGASIVVERVRCKPGGSQVTAVLPDGRVVLGLPGNPVAAVATLLVMLPAVVDGLTGRRPQPPWTAPLANASQVSGDVTRLLPARQTGNGSWVCDNAVRTAHLAGLIGRRAIALVPPGAENGDPVELVPLPQ